MHDTKIKTFKFRRLLAVIAAGLLPTLTHAVDKRVPAKVGATTAVQDAIDQCPDNDPAGCRIILEGRSYSLANSLFIRNKSNITITSANSSFKPELVFQDDGTKAGPDSDPDSLKLKPAGWKKWPNSCGTATGGSKNTANPFSTNGIQRNAVVLIQGSHNIVLDGISINGVKPIGWGKDGIWDCNYGVWYGNFGVNLYLSGKVTIRNSEIKNCFAGIYNFNRNKGGPMAVNNASDLDKENLVPNSRYGEMGGHLIEGNLIHDNVWGAYLESNWDLGSTWRFNRVYNCHSTTSIFATFTTSEAKNHTGGFMFLKDAVGTPERVYHNTFWQVSAIFGQGGWRGSINNYFYNNLVADPWMNYTSDSTGYLNSNFSTPYTNQNNMLWKSTQFMFANTFMPLKTNTNGTGKSWGDAGRLQFQIQGGSHTGNIKFLDGIQYQGQARGTIPQEWTLEEFDFKSINASKISHTVTTTNGPAKFDALDTAKVRAIIGGIPDEKGVMIPIKDTLGRIAAAGQTNMLPKNNHYLKTVQFQSTDATKANFLAPVWANTGVDSTIIGRLMQLDGNGNAVGEGGYGFVSNSVGKAVARGAVQPDGSLSVGMLTISDDQPVVLTGTTAVLSFGLGSNVGAVSNLKVLQACLYPRVSLEDTGATQNLGTCKSISTAGFTPAIGGNTVVMDFLADPGFNARFQLLIGGTTATGEQILSNVGIWMIHKAEQQFAVTFHKDKTDASRTDTTFAGDLVWMKLQPVKITGVTKPLSPPSIVNRPGAYEWLYDSKGKIQQRLDTVWIDKAAKKFRLATILMLDSTKPIKDTIRSYVDLDTIFDNTSTIKNVSINTQGMQDASGNPVEASAAFLASMQGPTWVQVRFTKATTGLGVIATGQDATKAVYQGSGTITVRPGPAVIAQWRDPSSYSVSSDSGTQVSYRAKYKATLDVKDSYGNLVDVAQKITVKVDARNGMDGTVGGGADKQIVLDVPTSGSVQTIVTPSTIPAAPPLDWFMLKSWVGSAATPATGTKEDSAVVHVQKLKWQFDWSVDSLRRLIKDTVLLTLKLQDGDGTQTSEAGLIAYLGSKNSIVKFYLPGKPETAIDQVDMSSGSVDVVVTSATETLDDELFASNPDVYGGQPAVITPVSFDAPPLPPIERAWYSDEAGLGTATHFTIKFAKELDNEISLRLSWPGKDGKMVVVDRSTAAATGVDSLRFDLTGAFVPGVTSSSTADLGEIKAVGRNVGYMTFAIQDSVAPALDSAVLTYGTYEDAASSKDMLTIYFTEPVSVPASAKTIIWNLVKKSGTEVLPTYASFSVSADGRSATLDYPEDPAWLKPLPGDSIRLAGGVDGGEVAGVNGVRAGKTSPRVVVKAGPRKAIDPKVSIFLPTLPGATPPSDQRELIALKPSLKSPFEGLGADKNVVIFAGPATLAATDELKVMSKDLVGKTMPSSGLVGSQGLKIPVNIGTIGLRSNLIVTIYDKYGTYVGKTEAEVVTADLDGIADATGKFDLVLMWDGKASNGALVNSGVYTMRAVLIRETSSADGSVQREVTFNTLKNLGIIR
ncbi:MAG: hypothetical protein RL318_1645 [Fibrobacterota bacterium]|jgi:hypothetical protein